MYEYTLATSCTGSRFKCASSSSYHRSGRSRSCAPGASRALPPYPLQRADPHTRPPRHRSLPCLSVVPLHRLWRACSASCSCTKPRGCPHSCDPFSLTCHGCRWSVILSTLALQQQAAGSDIQTPDTASAAPSAQLQAPIDLNLEAAGGQVEREGNVGDGEAGGGTITGIGQADAERTRSRV